MLRHVLNWLLLLSVVAALASGIFYFGAILPEYSLIPALALTATLLVWGMKWLLCREISWVWSPLHIPVGLFCAYNVVWYFFAPVEHVARAELLRVSVLTAVYFLVAHHLHRPRDRAILLYAVTLIAVAEALYAVWQFRTGSDFVLWLERGPEYQGRGSGTYYCPNHLAGLLAMTLGLLFGRFIVLREPDAPLQNVVLRRLYEATALVVIALGLYATLSRGGFIAAAGAFVVTLIFAELSRTISSRLAIVLFVAAALLAVAAILEPTLRGRLQEAFIVDFEFLPGEKPVEIKGGLAGRTSLWESTLKMIADHPVFGTGPGTWQWFYPQYRVPTTQLHPQFAHNDVFQLASEYGLLGFGLVVTALGSFFWQANRLARQKDSPESRAFAVGAVGAVTAILIHSFVDFNLHLPATALLLTILLGLIAAQPPADRAHWRKRVPAGARVAFGAASIVFAFALAQWSIRASLSARLTAQAYEAAQEHEWEDAIRLYWRALAHDHRSPTIHAQLGDLYRMQSAQISDPELVADRQEIAKRAIEAYRSALESNPFHSEVMLKQAAACELAGDLSGAFRWYEQAVRIDPHNAFNWIRIGVFYQRTGDTPKAIAALERAVQLHPADHTAPNLLKRYRGAQP